MTEKNRHENAREHQNIVFYEKYLEKLMLFAQSSHCLIVNYTKTSNIFICFETFQYVVFYCFLFEFSREQTFLALDQL